MVIHKKNFPIHKSDSNSHFALKIKKTITLKISIDVVVQKSARPKVDECHFQSLWVDNQIFVFQITVNHFALVARQQRLNHLADCFIYILYVHGYQ